MKKLKFTLLVLLLSSSVLYAQSPRISLYEEFSGENCGPCAAANPALWTTISANPSNCILLKYQSPIPSAGPIYNQFKTHTDNRMTYYSVPFAPYGRGNGKVQGTGANAGHISNFTQAEITSENAILSPFTINATHSWSPDGDSVYALVTITCTQAYNGGTDIIKLRSAIVEHLQFATPPGTNGETEFHNVMRQMYPDADGTTVGSSWTNGQTQTIVLAGKIPTYVDKTESVFMVLWLQNETSKNVLQAGKSAIVPIPIDLSIESVTASPNLQCATGNVNQVHTLSLKNKGTSTITSATINYRLDNGAYAAQAWSGSIASGASSNYTMPATSVGSGSHLFIDSLSNINGQPFEVNPANNVNFAAFNIHNTTVNALPIAIGFENAGNIPSGVTLTDDNSNFQKWRLVSGTGNIGFNNSKYCLQHNNYDYPDGESNIAILPTINTAATGSKYLNFMNAYTSYSTQSDALDVVYSTNCGSSWTSIWNKSGSNLFTAPVITSPFVPTQTQWAFQAADLTSVPANAIIGLRATSNFGNNLYIDNINISTATSITDVITAEAISVSPNPAKDFINITLLMPMAENAIVTLTDMTGKLILSKTYTNINKIEDKLNVSNLTPGIYNLTFNTKNSSATKKITIAN